MRRYAPAGAAFISRTMSVGSIDSGAAAPTATPPAARRVEA
jgi:hypothetical protein